MNNRILGFDLARAYAIFGMFIVNFTFCFGSFRDQSFLGKCSNLFIGNSTSIFIICAGMGIMLLTSHHSTSEEGKRNVKSIILKRSLFLFALGLLLYNWWPGDILHFYGGYMHIAALMLFVPKRYYLWASVLAFVIYMSLQWVIPITTSWDLQTTRYADFWTPVGFLRNTFYNGWNSIFPWFAYFSLGMYLGRLDWQDKRTIRKVFVAGLCMLVLFKSIRLLISMDINHPQRNGFYVKYWFQLMEDYFPVNIPFFMITAGWALMVISICVFLGQKYSESWVVNILSTTGKMTLSLYVVHTTAGVLILSAIANKSYTGFLPTETPIKPIFILSYALLFFAVSVAFSHFWSKKFNKGPIETLMRIVSR